jgi:hypothetical protein
MFTMDRRDFIKTTGAAALAGAGSPLLPVHAASPDLIKNENALSGASFQLTRMMPENAKSYRTSLIEGYCSRQSVKAGEKIDFLVSTNPVAAFTIDLFRMGYYGGAGARLMTTLGPFAGQMQPMPEMGENRLRECQWQACTTLSIPTDWPSGVYLGRLTTIPNDKVPKKNRIGRVTSSSSSKMIDLQTYFFSAVIIPGRLTIAGL